MRKNGKFGYNFFAMQSFPDFVFFTGGAANETMDFPSGRVCLCRVYVDDWRVGPVVQGGVRRACARTVCRVSGDIAADACGQPVPVPVSNDVPGGAAPGARAGRGDARAGRGNARAGRGEARTGRGNACAGRGEARTGRGEARTGRGDARAGRGNARAGRGNIRA